MQSFKRILVALDRSPLDDKLINYSLWFADSINAKKIYFVHFSKELRGVKKEYLDHQDNVPIDEKIKESIREKLEKYAPFDTLQIEAIVDEAYPLEGMLRWQRLKNIDLLIVGKKKFSNGSGIVSRKFLRLSACPVLFLPEYSRANIEKILVPVDFSDNSGLALQKAILMWPHFNKPDIICQHVYFSPAPTGEIKFKPEYARFIYQTAQEDYRHFIDQFELNNINITSVFTPFSQDDKVEKIIEFAGKNSIGLIIISAIGHTTLKLLTIGTTAEKLMLKNTEIPLLVMRRK